MTAIEMDILWKAMSRGNLEPEHLNTAYYIHILSNTKYGVENSIVFQADYCVAYVLSHHHSYERSSRRL